MSNKDKEKLPHIEEELRTDLAVELVLTLERLKIVSGEDEIMTTCVVEWMPEKDKL